MPRTYKRRYRRRYRGRTRVTQYKGATKFTSSQQIQPISYKAAIPYKAIEDVAVNYAKRNYPMAYQGYLLGKKAIEMLNAEKKYFDWSVASASVGTPGANQEYIYDIMAALTIGDGPNNRDGSQVRLKTIQLQMSFNVSDAWLTAATASDTMAFRYVLVLDNRPQISSALVYTDVFSTPTVANTFINIADQQGRFTILKNEMVLLNAAQTTAMIDIYQPVNLPIRYDGSGNVVKNQIWLMLACDENSATGNPPDVNFRGRIRYYDN